MSSRYADFQQKETHKSLNIVYYGDVFCNEQGSGGKLPLISEDKQNTRHGRHPNQTISTRMTLVHQLHILK